MNRLSRNRCFGGFQDVYRHGSQVLGCDMTFSVFLPPKAEKERCHVLYFLSGLTCTHENFTTKAGVQRYAAEAGLVVVVPDTSPRGEGVPDDPATDLGQGAGFYVNATQAPWSKHYRMYDYVTKELPELVEKNFHVTDRRSIFGHSMGGHGALVVALKNPGRYRSVSAFSPIVAPMRCPWGEKAFTAYLGQDREAWRAYDTTELVAQAKEKLPLFVDQGTEDPFLEKQLKPELLEEACRQSGHPLELRRQEGYDHSYYFIATFIEDHVQHHRRALEG